MSTNSSRSSESSGTGAGVHCHWFADDETILNELADGLAGVGVGDFVDFVGVEPDLALSASDNIGRKALLGAKVDPTVMSAIEVVEVVTTPREISQAISGGCGTDRNAWDTSDGISMITCVGVLT